MRVVIVEDEEGAARRLRTMLAEIREDYQVVSVLQSVTESVNWFNEHTQPDLVMMDIQLADGLSFSIFSQATIRCPIIFTTAFDQYAIRAFKVNSIDYLLKPIDAHELQLAIGKYERHRVPGPKLTSQLADQLLQSLNIREYKQRFLVKSGNALQYLDAHRVGFFYSEDGISFVRDCDNQRYIIDCSLDHLESVLDPTRFFRINRKIIVHIQSVEKIQPHLNGRWKLDSPQYRDIEMIVARDRSSGFKKWLDGE